ncbi:hypothetical protein [Thiomicrorhabdus sp.]|uniref:hypothetical protein n=1 Tax=Thiomicrorhabdus sp. TaxID=2039724 RepID=UPI0029C6FA99|nr:hypothetical protein [Thiomicrorhabdus sp.]
MQLSITQSRLRQRYSLGKFYLPRAWWLFVFSLFLFAQSASVVHAEIHPFHEHSVYCDAFDQAAEPRIDTPFFQFQLPTVEIPSFKPVFYHLAPQEVAYRNYSVRAPPSLNVSR